MVFMMSTVGSSSYAADVICEAPVRSPADTMIVFGFCACSAFMCAAK
jgi:hypothetical protein